MSNRLTALLGCKVPVIEGGLAYVGNGRLAAAVSEGGGFGQVGSGGRTPEGLAEEIEVALGLTSQPIGVNVPISEHRDPKPILDVIAHFQGRLKGVSLSAGNPTGLIGPMKALGLIVMTLASTPRQAMKAEQAGADAVICEGTEAGGHDGPSELTTLSLIPMVRRAVSIPVVAAGGIANGPTAAAAFALGADGIQMGTRFVASVECQAHPSYKEALILAAGEDTRVMERSLGRVTRVLKSPFVERILQQERAAPEDLETLLPMISGRRNAVAALDGKLDEGWLNCGQSVGFIEEVLPAADIVSQVFRDALRILKSRQQELSSQFD